MEAKFIKKVSKGSRFNQIYVPKEMEGVIETGDVVEVKLIKKHSEIFYSKGLKKLSEFKEFLIKNIFSFLGDFNYVNSVYIVGSFLTEKIDYNDIDIVIVGENLSEKLIYNRLTEKFNLKFHILIIEGDKLQNLLKICPLTRAMFSRYVTNSKLLEFKEGVIDKKHLKFLLMMPKDLLEINLNSRAYFDNLRRLATIEGFLKNNKLEISSINAELKKLIPDLLFNKIKNNEGIGEISIVVLRKIMKEKIDLIEDKIKDGKK